MRDVMTDPLCRPKDLGIPIPPIPYAVSVCLPTWKSIIGYEEKDPAVIDKLQSGYPRFFIHPIVSKLIEKVEKECARDGERALVFPKLIHAERCAEFIRKYGKGKFRAIQYGEENLGVILFSKENYDTARQYWNFCGEILSMRQAEYALREERVGRDSIEKGRNAVWTIKKRLAAFTGQNAEDVFLFPSGMAAIFAVHRMLTARSPDLKTVQIDFPFVSTLKLQQHFGAGAHFFPFVNEDDYERFNKIIKDESMSGIFSEIPNNPLLKCVDIRRVAEIISANGKKIPIVIDDTVATCVNIDAFRVADVAVTSLTKAFSGVGDVLAGSVILKRNSEFYPAFKSFLGERNDNELWPLDAIALEEHSRDFAERVRAESKNGLALYEFLAAHPAVERVYHSSNDTRGVYNYFLRPDGGHCSLLSFVLKDKSKTPKFFDSLQFCKGASIGTNFTLVSPYTMMAHYDELEWAEECGVDRNLIRVSCGLEPAEVIVGRMKRAFEKIL